MRPTSAAGIRWARAGLGLTLVLGLATPATSAEPKSTVSIVDHMSRSFRIPFNIDPAERAKVKEVLLTVSEDQGRTWTPISVTTPDRPALAYRASRDGEFWFSVQTRDLQGRLYPASTGQIEPKMKVLVDTVPPTLILKSNGRRGSLASVRWDFRDDRIDRNSFILEFQPEGRKEWRQVPLPKPTPTSDAATWDAGTAEPVRVRATVSDRAGNTKEVAIVLPDGTPENPSLGRGPTTELNEPPPLGSFASRGSTSRTKPSIAAEDPLPRMPATTAPEPSVSAPLESEPIPRPSDEVARPGREGSGVKPELIRSPRFNLQYEVDDAGPAGPATVELWVTLNGGRTWSRRGDDPDRKTPIAVDLGGDGTYGLTLVARSASNLGDQPPGPNDPPQYLVEVDSTPPVVRIDDVRVGTGSEAGRISVLWHATDLHLGSRPVVISIREEGKAGPWQPISSQMENRGRFDWPLPADAPQRFRVRIDVSDTAGNRGTDETPEENPIVVDRTRPRSRILRLIPSEASPSAVDPKPY